jgi:hypothetical protein
MRRVYSVDVKHPIVPRCGDVFARGGKGGEVDELVVFEGLDRGGGDQVAQYGAVLVGDAISPNMLQISSSSYSFSPIEVVTDGWGGVE